MDSIECISWSSSVCIFLPDLQTQVLQISRPLVCTDGLAWAIKEHGVWQTIILNTPVIRHTLPVIFALIWGKKKITVRSTGMSSNYNSVNLIRICDYLNICLVVRKYDHLIFLHNTFLLPYFCAIFFLLCFTKNMQEKIVLELHNN